jgi:hypothetical protein
MGEKRGFLGDSSRYNPFRERLLKIYVIYSYSSSSDQDMGPYPFINLSKLPGESLKTLLHLKKDSLFNHTKKLNQIYYSFGEYIGMIHACKFNEFGELALISLKTLERKKMKLPST